MKMMKILLIGLLCIFVGAMERGKDMREEGIGYKIGKIEGYTLLNQHNGSKLYEIKCPQVDDGRPIKLLELVGTHYEVGYAYGALLGPQIL